jgi:hypothetical protein
MHSRTGFIPRTSKLLEEGLSMSSNVRELLDEELIPVRGVVQLSTDLGLFLGLEGR